MAVNVFTVTLGGELLGTFDENELTLEDAFVLENTTDMTFSEMLQGCRQGKAKGLRALVWFMNYKRGTAGDLNAINFKITELSTEAVVNPPEAGDPDTGANETGTSESSPEPAT